jgi:hypothetical protein
MKGFAVDNALQFTVLTADGTTLTANAEENSELFWALRGGGPGAYAVILTATYKTHADESSAGMILEINSSHTNDSEVFWEAVRRFHSYSNHFVENGLYVYFEIGTTGQALRIHPIVGIGKSAEALTAVVKPLLDEWDAMGLGYSSETKGFATLYDLYIEMFEDEAAGGSALTGGWMFTHADVDASNDAITNALRNTFEAGALIVGHMWDAGHGVPSARWGDTSTHPRFRNASDFIITALPLAGNAPLAEKAAAQDKLTNNIDEGLRKAGPNGATYVNEVSDRYWAKFMGKTVANDRTGRSIPAELAGSLLGRQLQQVSTA